MKYEQLPRGFGFSETSKTPANCLSGLFVDVKTDKCNEPSGYLCQGADGGVGVRHVGAIHGGAAVEDSEPLGRTARPAL